MLGVDNQRSKARGSDSGPCKPHYLIMSRGGCHEGHHPIISVGPGFSYTLSCTVSASFIRDHFFKNVLLVYNRVTRTTALKNTASIEHSGAQHSAETLCMDFLISSSQPFYAVAVVITSTLQMRELRCRS